MGAGNLQHQYATSTMFYNVYLPVTLSTLQELAKALNTDVNSLPLSLDISWFEQKAVAVLLTLLNLGVQNIRLGPNLPGERVCVYCVFSSGQGVGRIGCVKVGSTRQVQAGDRWALASTYNCGLVGTCCC